MVQLTAKQRYYQRNRETLRAKARAKSAENWQKYKKRNPEKYIFYSAKRRAKQKGLDFDINLEDVVIPERCPILDIVLQFNENRPEDNSPSLDRIDNLKGYVKGNVHVISMKANMMKNNSSFEDIERLYLWTKSVR